MNRYAGLPGYQTSLRAIPNRTELQQVMKHAIFEKRLLAAAFQFQPGVFQHLGRCEILGQAGGVDTLQVQRLEPVLHHALYSLSHVAMPPEGCTHPVTEMPAVVARDRPQVNHTDQLTREQMHTEDQIFTAFHGQCRTLDKLTRRCRGIRRRHVCGKGHYQGIIAQLGQALCLLQAQGA